jgi:hypothetical protein
VSVCDREALIMRKPRPTSGSCAKGKKYETVVFAFLEHVFESINVSVLYVLFQKF